jgi:hypothetical protein
MFNAAFVSSPGEGRNCFGGATNVTRLTLPTNEVELLLPAGGER